MLMSKFFVDSCRLDYNPVVVPSRTPVVTYKQDSEGHLVKCIEVAEELDRPESRLSYSDMTIGTLIRAGIKPTALHITSDNRLGVDTAEFNSKVDELFERIEKTEIPD